MSNKIMLFATVGGIFLATSALALPLNPLQSDNSIVKARTVCDIYGRCWTDVYPGNAIRPGAPLFEGRSIYMHEGYMYDPVDRRHYDRTRGRWVTDVGSLPIR
jgi:hypothetical protein